MPTPLLAELDPVQIAIIVIAMLGGFFQWLWSLIQQGKGDAEKRQPSETLEEKKLREEAWRRQTQGQKPVRPSTATPPPIHDPFAPVRELFEQIKREAQGQQPAPSTPPPLPASPPPQQAKRGSVRADLTRQNAPQSAKRHSVAADLAATTPAASSTPPVSLPTAPAAPLVQLPEATRPAVAPAWAGLLGSPAALRQAFILREILGPPKALQTANDAAA